MKNILVVWDRMGEYHHARLVALAQLLGEHQVFAADLGASDALYQWKTIANPPYAHRVLSKKPVGARDLWNRVRNYVNLLKNEKIDVVAISGYGRLEYILFILISKLRGVKVILFAESWYGNNKIKNFMKGKFLTFFVDGFFVSGIRAQAHFHTRLNIPLAKIKTGYSVVDNDHFSSHPPSTNQHLNESTGRRPHKQINKSPNKPVLLCVARYSPEKNLPFLISAFRASELYRQWQLVLIGDGPQKEELIKLVGADTEHIVLTGWKFYEELPHWYQNANAFVLPSIFEPWGLVVNEALAAGISVLASTACGCVPDLLEEEYTFEPEDASQLLRLLNNLTKINTEVFLQKNDYLNHFSPQTWSATLFELAAHV